MNGAYTATVRQLLDIAPVVFTTPHFAIKGGTALNLFLHNLPRLSVDIDVVFTNHSLGREAALQAIASELSAVSQKLEAMGYEVRQRRNSASNETRLMVIGPLAEVKVEVNEVFRGTLLPLQQRSLSPATEEEFAQAVSLPLLATAELYGSKLVAAMDRQHPRDLFDVLILYNDTGLTPEIVLTWDGVMQKLHNPGGPPALQSAGCGSSPFTSNCLRRKWCTVLSSRQRIETFWPLASSCTST